MSGIVAEQVEPELCVLACGDRVVVLCVSQRAMIEDVDASERRVVAKPSKCCVEVAKGVRGSPLVANDRSDVFQALDDEVVVGGQARLAADEDCREVQFTFLISLVDAASIGCGHGLLTFEHTSLAALVESQIVLGAVV